MSETTGEGMSTDFVPFCTPVDGGGTEDTPHPQDGIKLVSKLRFDSAGLLPAGADSSFLPEDCFHSPSDPRTLSTQAGGQIWFRIF